MSFAKRQRWVFFYFPQNIIIQHFNYWAIFHAYLSAADFYIKYVFSNAFNLDPDQVQHYVCKSTLILHHQKLKSLTTLKTDMLALFNFGGFTFKVIFYYHVISKNVAF